MAGCGMKSADTLLAELEAQGVKFDVKLRISGATHDQRQLVASYRSALVVALESRRQRNENRLLHARCDKLEAKIAALVQAKEAARLAEEQKSVIREGKAGPQVWSESH